MYHILGLKDQNDNWIINDKTGTSTRYAAGSRITFERRSSKTAEKLLINGPTTEPLQVMVRNIAVLDSSLLFLFIRILWHFTRCGEFSEGLNVS